MDSRSYLEDILYGRRRSGPIEALLLMLSVIYRTAVGMRALLYRAGLFRTHKLPVKVISVGNITLGGTGKTPAVVAIAEHYRARGARPAVLSRGYGRKDGSAIEIVSDGVSLRTGPGTAGDEPAMIANRLPDVPVVVGSDRFKAGRLAADRFHPDVIILDDGFQHLRLARDVNIVLLDGAEPFGNGRLFPAGILREPLAALGRADAVLITRADRSPDREALRASLGHFTDAPVIMARHVPLDLVDVATGATRPLAVLKGSNVLAFAGIARPSSLEDLLRSLGAEIGSLRVYPDHYQYTNRDVKLLVEEAGRSASLLVTTEKDGIKLKGMATAGIWMLRIRLEVEEKDRWENVLV